MPRKAASTPDVATSSPRTIWKGSITFGLVYIPVALYPASKDQSLDFDWLDKRDMSPVGYKRVNKVTGKEVTKENIVKGLAYSDGRYAILTDDEIRASHPKATQTVELLSFVDEGSIPPEFFERPYFLAPTAKGEKVYSLLRETLRKEKKVGIAYVIIATKQHLAAVIPGERALMLMLLRWKNEIRDDNALGVPPAGKSAGVKPAELAMATQLVQSMSEKWDPGQYEDTFRGEIMVLVKKKVAAGKTTEILAVGDTSEERPSAKILDLTDLLKRSLSSGKKSNGAKAPREAVAGKSKVTALKPKIERKVEPEAKRKPEPKRKPTVQKKRA